MTVLIVLGSIVLLLSLLLYSPVYMEFSYRQELIVRFRYLFLVYRVPLEAEDVETAVEAAVESDNDKSLVRQLSDVFKRNDLQTIINLLRYAVKVSSKAAKSLLRKLKFKECRFKMIIGSENAAETAVNYGYACATVYPAFGTFFEYVRCKKKKVAVYVDFGREETVCDICVRLRIVLLFLIIEAIKVFKGFMPILRWIKAKERKVEAKHGVSKDNLYINEANEERK